MPTTTLGSLAYLPICGQATAIGDINSPQLNNAESSCQGVAANALRTLEVTPGLEVEDGHAIKPRICLTMRKLQAFVEVHPGWVVSSQHHRRSSLPQSTLDISSNRAETRALLRAHLQPAAETYEGALVRYINRVTQLSNSTSAKP